MSLQELRELATGLGVPVVLGAAGCLVRASRFGVRSWRQFAASVAASCFVAVVVYWLLDAVDFPPTVDAGIVGISGYMGGVLLDALQDRAIKTVTHGGLPGSPGGHQ